jgi:NAD(P)-dependent dehydrogenase (short-subunit alcohol dehydrogenase family)
MAGLALVSGANRGIGFEVADSESIAGVPAAVERAGGVVRARVNNAGVYPPGYASRMDFDVVEQTLRINTVGARRPHGHGRAGRDALRAGGRGERPVGRRPPRRRADRRILPRRQAGAVVSV